MTVLIATEWHSHSEPMEYVWAWAVALCGSYQSSVGQASGGAQAVAPLSSGGGGGAVLPTLSKRGKSPRLSSLSTSVTKSRSAGTSVARDSIVRAAEETAETMISPTDRWKKLYDAFLAVKKMVASDKQVRGAALGPHSHAPNHAPCPLSGQRAPQATRR